jgi:hypothetical protein
MTDQQGAIAMPSIGRTCLAIGAVGLIATLALPATAADYPPSLTYGAYNNAYGGTYAYGGAYAYAPVAPYDGAYAAYDAVMPVGPYGGYGYGRPWRGGSYYSYGADRANPSLAPNGWDQDNPRDQQLQGHN